MPDREPIHDKQLDHIVENIKLLQQERWYGSLHITFVKGKMKQVKHEQSSIPPQQ